MKPNTASPNALFYSSPLSGFNPQWRLFFWEMRLWSGGSNFVRTYEEISDSPLPWSLLALGMAQMCNGLSWVEQLSWHTRVMPSPVELAIV